MLINCYFSLSTEGNEDEDDGTDADDVKKFAR